MKEVLKSRQKKYEHMRDGMRSHEVTGRAIEYLPFQVVMFYCNIEIGEHS